MNNVSYLGRKLLLKHERVISTLILETLFIPDLPSHPTVTFSYSESDNDLGSMAKVTWLAPNPGTPTNGNQDWL